MSVQKARQTARIVIEGTRLAEMEAAARKQFSEAFCDTRWELVAIDARLEMVQIGTRREEWTPGLWSATYEAREL